jgi:hypothetical protein
VRVWGAIAEDACARLSQPPVDVATADRDVEALIRRSWLWSRVDGFASIAHAAWLDSACRRLIISTTNRS